MKVVLNKDEANVDVPKVTLNFVFDKLALALEQNQYQNVMDMLERYTLYFRGAKVLLENPSLSSCPNNNNNNNTPLFIKKKI